MWALKQKVTNEQTKQTDTDNRRVVTGGGEDEKGRGDITCGDKMRLDVRW